MAETGQGQTPGEPVIPGYSQIELISRGSTARVYRAVQERLNRAVAIKVLRVDDVMTTADQVRTELATTVALSAQPHIVSIIDTGTTDTGKPYIVMEYCEGGSYGHILAKSGPLPVQEAVDVGVKVAEALQAAHEVGIIHRDVKPHNILRSKYGPALTDFGIARAAADLTGTITLHKLTPQHASPESLRREPQGPASDVYSLASTLWNLLAGYPPFADPGDNSPDPFEYRDRALRNPLPPLPRPDVPAWLQDELVRGMAKAPGERHASAGEFAASLRRGWLRSTGELWTPPPGQSTAPPTPPPPAPAAPETFPASPFGNPPPPSGTPAFGAPPPAPSYGPPGGPAGLGAPVSGAPAFGPPAGPPPVATPGGYGPGGYGPGGTVPGSPGPGTVPGGYATFGADGGPGHGGQVGYGTDVAAPPADGEPRRRMTPWPFVAAAVAGVLIGVVVLVALRFSGHDRTPAAKPTPTATTGPRASEDPTIRPTGVKLADHGTWVQLSWTDHTNGKALYFVTGSVAGGTPSKLSQPARDTTRRIDALRADSEYCFYVVGMMTIDRISPSDRVCTHRNGATPSATGHHT
ncbi:serine/threonine-protein kinase [Actinocatenispora rupis]|uniref:serine/threonine-protein kinase n=1 Tax=Actinocatenispora rupis TaxID=519421 RepID=UPI0019443294|nr:serine/threonine-protein kinase [Actinocatenispora rupis]